MDNKRVISYLLAIIMLFGTLINPVFAISSNPNKGEEAKYEIQEIDGKLYKAYKISDLGLKNPEKLLTPKYRTRAAGDPMENWVKLLLQSNTVGLTFGDDFDIEVFVAIRRKKTKIAVAKINPTKEIVENEYFYFVKTDEYDENNPDHQNPDKWYLYVEDDFKYDIRLKYGESGNFGSETMTMTINQRAIPLYKAVWLTNNQQRPIVKAIYTDGDNLPNNVNLNNTDFAENEYKSVSSEKMPFTVAQKEVIVKEENLGTVDKEKFLVSDMKGAALWKLEIEQDGVKKTKGTIEDGDTNYHFNITGDFKTPFVATMREELKVKFDPNGAKWVDAETGKEKEAKSYPIGHSMKLNESFGDLDKVTVPVAKDIKDIPEKDGVAQEFKGWTTETNKGKTYDELVAADQLIYPDDVKAEKFEKQIKEKQAEIDELKKKIVDNKATINKKLGHLKETDKLRKENADFEKEIEEKSKELDKIKAYQIGYQTIVENNTTFYAVYEPKPQGKVNFKYVDENGNKIDDKYQFISKLEGKDIDKDTNEKLTKATKYPKDKKDNIGKTIDAALASTAAAPTFIGYKIKSVKLQKEDKDTTDPIKYTKDGDYTVVFVYEKLADIIPEKGDDGKPNPKATEDVKETYVKVIFNADDDKHTGKNQRGKLYLGDTEPADDKKVDQLVYYVNPKADPAKTLKNVIDENKVNVKANANYEVEKDGENVSWTFGLKAGKDETSLAEIKEHSISDTSQVVVNQTDNDGNDLLTEIILTANYKTEQGTVKYEYTYDKSAVATGEEQPADPTFDKAKDKTVDVGTKVVFEPATYKSIPVKKQIDNKDIVVGNWVFQGWKYNNDRATEINSVAKGDNIVTGEWKYVPETPVGVNYKFTFDGEDTQPTVSGELNKFPTITQDTNKYYPGQEITLLTSPAVNATVKGNKVVDGETQPGTWTFEGWYKRDETKNITKYTVKADDTNTINFVGKWSFKADGMVDATFEYKYFKEIGNNQTEALTDKGAFAPKATEKKSGFVGKNITLPEFSNTTNPKNEEKVSTGTLRGTWKFDGWYKDDACTTKANNETFDQNGNKFFGKWVLTEDSKYGITYAFEFNKGGLTDLADPTTAEGLPEVPEDKDKYYANETVNAKNLSANPIPVYKGANKIKIGDWVFKGWKVGEEMSNSLIVSGTKENKFVGVWEFEKSSVRPTDPNDPKPTSDEVTVIFKNGLHGKLSGIDKNGNNVTDAEVLAFNVNNKAKWSEMKAYIPEIVPENKAEWKVATPAWSPNLPNDSATVVAATYTAQYEEKLVRPTDPDDPKPARDEVTVRFLKGEHGTLTGIVLNTAGEEVIAKGKDKLAYNVKTKATWAAMKDYIPSAIADSGWRVANPSWKPILPEAKEPVKEATYTAQYVAKPTDRYITLTLDENYRNGKITDYEVVEGDLIEDYLYIPRRRGYVFEGWSYNSRRLEEVRPGDRVYYPTTLYAIWAKQKAKDDEEVEPIDTRAVNEHKAYMFGYTDGSVRPNGSITRAEAAALVTRLLGIEANASSMKPAFTDTPSSWYNKAINAAVARGIMKGYPDGRFRPNAPITRAEFTQMIYTFDNKPYGVAPFADVVGHWAERAIGSEYQAKRITGYPDGLFRPDANITRAEAVVILNKIFERNYDAMSPINAMNKEKIKVFTDLHTSFWGFNDMVEATNTHLFKRRRAGFVEEDWTLVK